MILTIALLCSIIGGVVGYVRARIYKRLFGQPIIVGKEMLSCR